MNQYSNSTSSITWLIAGMAIGAAVMYVLDPVQGRRRRALAKDKAYSASLHSQKAVNAKMRHLSNRAQGLRAKASHMLH